MRKSPVSCLTRKSLVPRENLMSFQYLVPPQRENLLSPVSWENLVSQEKISGLFSFWSPPNEKIFCLLSHEKISCLKRKSHILSVLGPPPKEKISCLLSHEKISCLKRKTHVLAVFGPPPMRKSPVSCLMRKSHVPREKLMYFQFWFPP